MARLATEIILGKKLSDLNLTKPRIKHFGVKNAVFPFAMLPEVDPMLGPEMRSTGEVLGLSDSFGMAYYKAQVGAKQYLPLKGSVLISVCESDRREGLKVARAFTKLGFKLFATRGTSQYLAEHGLESEMLLKLHEGNPNIVDSLQKGDIDLLINTPSGRLSAHDDSYLRKAAVKYRVPYIITLTAALAAAEGIAAARKGIGEIHSLQSYHSENVEGECREGEGAQVAANC